METIIALYRDHLLFLTTVAGLLGLAVGSFLGVAATRLPAEQSLIHPPSACDHCRQRLQPIDLVPIAGYLLLRGKCRHCGVRVPLVYPLIEAATGCLFALVAWRIGFQLELLAGLLLISVLITITITDIQRRIIPDKVVFFGMGAMIVLRIFTHSLPWWNYGVAFVIGGGILYLLALLSVLLMRKEGMGGGDIKLFAFLGLVLGINQTLFTLFAAALLGLIGGLLQRSVQARVNASGGSSSTTEDEEYIAFGPYIAMAAIISYIWGDQLISMYLSFVLH